MVQITDMKNIFLRSVWLLAIAALAGCAWRATQTGSVESIPAAAATPPASVDLSPPRAPSGLSAHSSIDAPSSSDSKPRTGATPDSATGPASVQANLNRLFIERPGGEQFAGSAIAPGGEKLLNDKAAHFAQFTRPLLDRLFAATEDLERQKLARSGVPENVRPVIIEATMDGDGQLTELVLQQLSGSGAVDQLMIQACKKGLWMRNPPPEARAGDGNYRMRIEASIRNYIRPTAFADWTFRTHLGLALE
jgi:hypothetical protein